MTSARDLPVCAYLVEGGRVFRARAIVDGGNADEAVTTREDGSISSPLVRLKDAEAALSKLQAENDKLRAGYAEAIDDIEGWGAYASMHLRERYDFPGIIAKHRAAVEAAGDAGEAT